MDENVLMERLNGVALSPQQEERLHALVMAVFAQAIDARSPKNRPPGKAGLRAEKGYYRLLYLEGEFQQTVRAQDQSREPVYDWDVIPVILRQLKDLPELQTQIMAGIDDALNAVIRP